MTRWLERLAILVASLVLSAVLVLLLAGYFTARDQSALRGPIPAPRFRAFLHRHTRECESGHARITPRLFVCVERPRPRRGSRPLVR